jgi:hypothetical protein
MTLSRRLARRVYDSQPLAEHSQHRLHLVEPDGRLALLELDDKPLANPCQLADLPLAETSGPTSFSDKAADCMDPIGNFYMHNGGMIGTQRRLVK